MSQSHTRKHPRMEVLQGEHAKQKEHAQQVRKIWLAISPALIAGAVIAALYFMGVKA